MSLKGRQLWITLGWYLLGWCRMNLIGFMFHFCRKQKFCKENKSVPLKLNKLLSHKSIALFLLQNITCRNSLFPCNKASGRFNITSSSKSREIVLSRECLVGDECQIKLQFCPKGSRMEVVNNHLITLSWDSYNHIVGQCL